MIRIHNFPHGARGLRAGWVCEEMALAYEVVPVTYPPSEDFLRRNPVGTVPTVEDGAVTISESVAIMLYLSMTYGPTPLLPRPDDPAFASVLELTIFGEASLDACINPLLAAHFAAPPEKKRNWSVEMLEGRVDRLLGYLSERLGANPYLVGPALTLADISIETAMRMWQEGLGKSAPDNLAAYRERLSALASCQRAVLANG